MPSWTCTGSPTNICGPDTCFHLPQGQLRPPQGWLRPPDTHVNLAEDDVNDAADDNQEVEHIPGVPKVALGGQGRSRVSSEGKRLWQRPGCAGPDMGTRVPARSAGPVHWSCPAPPLVYQRAVPPERRAVGRGGWGEDGVAWNSGFGGLLCAGGLFILPPGNPAWGWTGCGRAGHRGVDLGPKDTARSSRARPVLGGAIRSSTD